MRNHDSLRHRQLVRGILAPALALPLLLLACLPTVGLADNTPQLIQEMAEIEDPDRVREICEQIQGSEPKKYALYFCEGIEAIFLGADLLAEQSLEAALAEQSDFALAALIYGDVYASLGKTEKAARYYRWASDIQPRRSDAKHSLGMLYLEQARAGDDTHLPEALEAFRQMAELSPSSPEGYTSMGLVLTYMGRYDDAEQVYKAAISKAPSDPFLYDNLASLYARQDRNKEAEATWKEALRVNPGYGASVIELASLQGRTGKLVEAVRFLEDGKLAVVAPPWGPRIRRNLGYAFLGMGDTERSRNLFIDAVTGGSNDALSHLGLAHLRMVEGNTNAALPRFRRGTALDSVLAEPFVLAWRPTLKFALKENEIDVLSRLVDRLSAGQTVGAQDRAELLGGTSGPEASNSLVQFVLEGWDFSGADLALERILSPDEEEPESAGYDTAPVPIRSVPAEYPEEEQQRGVEGEVMVLVTIDETGRVTDAKVEESNTFDSLNKAAVAAAKQWVFDPATRYGAPVKSSIVIPFRFVRRND